MKDEWGERLNGKETKVLAYEIVGNEFELQSRYYV